MLENKSETSENSSMKVILFYVWLFVLTTRKCRNVTCGIVSFRDQKAISNPSEPTCGSRESNPCPLQEQQMLLSTKSSLQLLKAHF